MRRYEMTGPDLYVARDLFEFYPLLDFGRIDWGPVTYACVGLRDGKVFPAPCWPTDNLEEWVRQSIEWAGDAVLETVKGTSIALDWMYEDGWLICNELQIDVETYKLYYNKELVLSANNMREALDYAAECWEVKG